MKTNTQETIARLRELKKLATPEPWSIETNGLEYPVEVVHHTVNMQGEPDYLEVFMRAYSPAEGEYAESEEGVNIDVRYAVCLVNAVPDLLAEIDRLTAENTQLLDTVAEAWDEGYLDKEAEAGGVMIHSEPRERAKNPYKKDN